MVSQAVLVSRWEGDDMPTHKVKLQICGSAYVVSTNDSEEYLVGLAERLDTDMNQVMMEAPNASIASAAIVTALAYLDEAEKNAFGADNMRAQLQDYLEDAAKAKIAAEEAKREAARLRRELTAYERQADKSSKRPSPLNSELHLPEENTPPQTPVIPIAPPVRPASDAGLDSPIEVDENQIGLEDL